MYKFLYSFFFFTVLSHQVDHQEITEILLNIAFNTFNKLFKYTIQFNYTRVSMGSERSHMSHEIACCRGRTLCHTQYIYKYSISIYMKFVKTHEIKEPKL